LKGLPVHNRVHWSHTESPNNGIVSSIVNIQTKKTGLDARKSRFRKDLKQRSFKDHRLRLLSSGVFLSPRETVVYLSKFHSIAILEICLAHREKDKVQAKRTIQEAKPAPRVPC
jgi:hypothetical protein